MEQQITTKNWYDKYYKLMMIVPLLLFIICMIYLFNFNSKNGDIMYKDVSLTGGTIITLHGSINSEELEASLKQKYPDIRIRTISELATSKNLAVIIESQEDPDSLKAEIESILDIKLTKENSSIEFSGPSLGQSFYKQLITALIISFILMSIVIFLLFKSFIPSVAVIFAVFADIVMPLALLDYMGVSLSAAGIAAFLMLIGYSVDTDILLTTRVIKNRRGTVNQRIYSSFKTGIFMTGTALIAVLPAFLLITGLPDSFRQIFLILTIGLFADIVNTWLTNAGIIKWYAESKGI
ncbi:MAG: protein translocase subunit SecF [Nanoarchaeota archaeon]|nr:protein translocase subunit SecF [Nanoarchaeota archaeon]